MTDELTLRRKWTRRAHGRRMVFVKRPVESREHISERGEITVILPDLEWVRL